MLSVYEKPVSLPPLDLRQTMSTICLQTAHGVALPQENSMSQRCRLHLDEEPDDAGDIQKRMKLKAQYYLPVSDIVNSPQAGFASVPGWCDVWSTTLTTIHL